MLTKAGLLSLLDRMKEAVERGSELGVLRYEKKPYPNEEYEHGEYMVHATIKGFGVTDLDHETRIDAQ